MLIYSKLFAKFYNTFLQGFEQKISQDPQLCLKNLKEKLIDEYIFIVEGNIMNQNKIFKSCRNLILIS